MGKVLLQFRTGPSPARVVGLDYSCSCWAFSRAFAAATALPICDRCRPDLWQEFKWVCRFDLYNLHHELIVRTLR